MPTRQVPEKLSEEEFIARLMGEIREYLPLLSGAEINRLLAGVRSSLERTISLFEEMNLAEAALLSRIAAADTCGELGGIHAELNRIEMERFLSAESVPALHANCTEYRDILAGRALELTMGEMEASSGRGPGVPYALISMGSDGREEQTLITDQDYLLVYADGGGDTVDEWFREFSDLLVERMEEVGFAKCTGDIMPSNPTWRGSISQWRRKLLAIVRYEYADYAKNLMDLIVLSDARYVAGDEALANELVAMIRGLEQDYFQVLWGMAKAATEMRLALGFLKRIWTEGSGEHKGEFNLKLLAWAPLVMNVRILAINQGIPATSTLRRIELLQREGSFSRSMAAGLSDAYLVLTKHRILQQVRVVKGIQKSSYYLNPYQLPGEERERIRQALLRVEELQKVIHTNFSIM